MLFPREKKNPEPQTQTPARSPWLRSPAGPPPRCLQLGRSRCPALPPPQVRPPAPAGTLRVILAHPPAPPPRAAVGCRFPFHLEIFSGGRSSLVISARRKRHRRGSRGEPAGRAGHSRAGHSRAEPAARSPLRRSGTDLSAGPGVAAAARGFAGAGGVGACRRLLPLPPPSPPHPRRAGNMN